MIEVRNVSKIYPTRFGEKLVLDDISFNLRKGEKIGVLGRNGAGKSTLVRLVSGAELPTSGTIRTSMSVSWPLAFGGAFQDTLTGVDNVRFISRIYNQDFETNLAFVEDFAELGPYLREEVRTYSSGMRARLAFAISMIIEFDCFLIDEVGAVGDARFHNRCNLELFEKRSDRAMVIISHDASYVRDHCNRFGVLHDGRLKEFDDFEVAYSDFREKIGLEASRRPIKEDLPLGRNQLIETTHTVAVRDDAFRVLVQQADWDREEGNWEKAEAGYADALDLYPYQRSYWAQKAHCAKEAGAFIRAEAAYRTACALGEPVADVHEHFAFTLKKQSVPEDAFPLRNYSKREAKDQPPGIPDVDIFAKALWHVHDLSDEEQLRLLREFSTCDQLLAGMMDDQRFEIAQRDVRWEEYAGKDVRLKQSADLATIPTWVRNLVSLAKPDAPKGDLAGVANRISSAKDAWPVINVTKGFSDWEAAQSFMKRVSVR